MPKAETPCGPDQQYLALLEQGRFCIQREAATGRHHFYPRVLAPQTGGALTWVDASGLGQVYATTTVRARPPAADYNVCVVELDEGPRLMSRVENMPASEVRIGMRVRARIATEGDLHFIVFDPVESA